MDSTVFFAAVLFAVFGVTVLWMISLSERYVEPLIGKGFKALFGWATGADLNGWVPGEREAISEEAKTYVHDGRLMMVACLAKFAKIDGVVTKNEIGAIEEVFGALDLTKDQRRQAIDTFNQAKQGKCTLRACIRLLADGLNHDAEWMLLLILMFFKLAHADGSPNVQTQRALQEICDWVGFGYQECAKIYAGSKQRPSDAPDKNDLGAAYTVLGCQPTDALSVIKDRYRKLVKDFHPDTVISKGLPTDFVKFAEERFKQIQAAYETIMAARGSKAA